MVINSISKKITSHGRTLNVDVSDKQPIYLRRSTLIKSTHHLTSRPQSFGQHWFSPRNFFLGAPLSVNRWMCEEKSAALTAGLGYYGEVIEIPVSPNAPVFVNVSQYLGHMGELDKHTQKIAKKEFWFMAKFSGSGRVFLHVPVGYEQLPIENNNVILDHKYASAIWGSFVIRGQELDIKSWAKSGETDNVVITGQCNLIISKALSSSQANSSILGTLLNLFT